VQVSLCVGHVEHSALGYHQVTTRQADRPNRRNMEPLRRWRPLRVTIGLGAVGN